MSRILVTLDRSSVLMHDLAMTARQVVRECGWDPVIVDLRFLPLAADAPAISGIIAQVVDATVLRLLPRGIPLINVSERLADFHTPAVLPDQRAVAETAFRHLHAAGYRSFAVLGLDGIGWAQRRAEAFAACCRTAGLPCRVSGSKRHDAAIMREAAKPLGAFGVSDVRCLQAAAQVRSLGFRISFDVGLVGVDDDQTEQSAHGLPLSSVPLPSRAIAETALALLRRLMLGDGVPDLTRIAPPALIVRRSSQPESGAKDDPVVAAAQAAIASSAIGLLSPDDVARRIGVPRRTLEAHFVRQVGRSVREEIVRRRLDLAETLLRDAGLAIDELALRCGFSSRQRLAVAFKQRHGCSPAAWRQRQRG
jgi:LacI family transcriptional regulator